MGNENKIEYRVMGDYSIAKSYKGILRIAHIMEIIDGETDAFNNNSYYGSPSSLMNISGNASSKAYGFPNASVGFQGQVQRYISEKKYKDKKLPVTDSMGNYINWNLGTDDSTIGSDMTNNGYSLGNADGDNSERYFYQSNLDKKILQSYLFPVIESKELVIGLEPKLISAEKRYFSKKSSLDIKDDDYTSTLVLYNLYDSSENNREIYDGDGDIKTYRYKKAVYTHTDEEGKKVYDDVNYRSILRNDKKEVEEYDAFVYCQENYNVNNFNYSLTVDDDEINYNKDVHGTVNQYTNIDAEVNIVNLKDYVKDIIKKYMKSNVVEVPTGTVISQYISPEKWYAKTDTGSGNRLGKDVFVGHRPSMGQRNYESSSNNNNKKGENTTWNSTTIEGVSLKTNRLILENDYSKIRDEADSDDPSFDSSKLKELIPLYKRDYVLCDGSLYHIFLSTLNKNRNEIRRKYQTLDRFLNLFYVIGYNYTFPKSSEKHIFSDIRKRSKCKIDTTDTKNRLRYINGYGNFIDSNNFMNFAGSPTEVDKEIKDGVIQNLNWDSSEMENLKEIESIYSIDLGTMLAFKLLMTEDAKSDNAFKNKGKYDRTKAEEWLKNQNIPREYIFNSFVGDSNESFKSYSFTKEAEVSKGSSPYVMELSYDYTHGEIDDENTVNNLPKIRIGREVNSFKSLVKYYIPGHEDKDGSKIPGRYCVCELWQIPEIQYLLDVMSLTGGERIEILPVFFQYTFRVPNLTDVNAPTFIGSTGYNWRDSNEKMIQNESSWTSTMSSGTVPHRHAVFKSPLTGFSDNANREKFKGQILMGDGEIASGSVNYHSRTKFPQGGKNGAAGKFVTDNTGSYLWNELGPNEGLVLEGDIQESDDTQKSDDKKSMPYKILQRTDFPNSDAYPDYYSEKNIITDPEDETKVDDYGFTGKTLALDEKYTYEREYRVSFPGFRRKSKTIYAKKGPKGTLFPKTGRYSGNISTSDPATFPKEEETDFNEYIKWFKIESKTWYSFWMDEDPRFVNFEPNRCITGPPKPVTLGSGASYNKNELNKEASSTGTCFYFAPENVKMLPLIKL